jgi:hypothetical protein
MIGYSNAMLTIHKPSNGLVLIVAISQNLMLIISLLIIATARGTSSHRIADSLTQILFHMVVGLFVIIQSVSI